MVAWSNGLSYRSSIYALRILNFLIHNNSVPRWAKYCKSRNTSGFVKPSSTKLVVSVVDSILQLYMSQGICAMVGSSIQVLELRIVIRQELSAAQAMCTRACPGDATAKRTAPGRDVIRQRAISKYNPTIRGELLKQATQVLSDY